MFKITAGKGFQIKFDNGWTVSVQFGLYNYCNNREHGYASSYDNEREAEIAANGCANAEIAAWNKHNRWYDFGGDTVKGWVTPEELLQFLNEIAAKTE